MMEALCKDGLKGQQAISPGHRPGYIASAEFISLTVKRYRGNRKALDDHIVVDQWMIS
jgi:hypothetical protein